MAEWRREVVERLTLLILLLPLEAERRSWLLRFSSTIEYFLWLLARPSLMSSMHSC